MKKTVMFILFLILTTFSYSEIKVSIFENMKLLFKQLPNTFGHI